MTRNKNSAPVRLLPEDVANKIAAGEVVERPASVVKELVENALDAGATRITVRVVGAGRRLIEVTDNGHGMGEQDALMAIERHATSKIRNADDLDNITTLGFRGEALASIAAVSRFEMVTRREKDEAATQIQVDGGILRHTGVTGAPVGTRITVNRLYFNTPVRAKFLKGITTELSHCIDVVQRHALVNQQVGFQFIHNEKMLLDVPEHASLRERVALMWGLKFVQDMVEVDGEQAGFRVSGLIGSPGLTRSSRSHQFFFLNDRPVVNRSLQFGFEDGYQGLLTIGRHPVGVLMLETHPRFVDVNIHPSKREIRFRDERSARDAIRDIVRRTMDDVRIPSSQDQGEPRSPASPVSPMTIREDGTARDGETPAAETVAASASAYAAPAPTNDAPPIERDSDDGTTVPMEYLPPVNASLPVQTATVPDTVQTEIPMGDESGSVSPGAVYRPVEPGEAEALQLFDTYLLVPEDDRLLIIDQHALHERLNYDMLVSELNDRDYGAQQLVVPVLIDVPPSSARLLEKSLDLFAKMGIEIESFGGNTFQVTGICHLYEEAHIADAVYKILDELAQGNLFDKDVFQADFLRLATVACRASIKAGDRLTPEEKQELIDGFRRMRPPYTCPHGRPIITELTLVQMEKSFRRRQ
jgi:DNA mismatch repair protein MutL